MSYLKLIFKHWQIIKFQTKIKYLFLRRRIADETVNLIFQHLKFSFEISFSGSQLQYNLPVSCESVRLLFPAHNYILIAGFLWRSLCYYKYKSYIFHIQLLTWLYLKIFSCSFMTAGLVLPEVMAAEKVRFSNWLRGCLSRTAERFLVPELAMLLVVE